MKYYTIALSLIALTLQSCSQQQSKSQLSEMDQSSAREVSLSSVEQADKILHITKQKIWANGQIVSEKTDTIVTPKTINDWNSTTQTSLVKVPIYVTVQ